MLSNRQTDTQTHPRCAYAPRVINTDTECTRAIASTLIHAVVLCENAQRYRALMVILQSHRTQNMILRCYPTVSAIYFGDIPNLVSCAFSTIPIFLLFNSQNFLFTCTN